MPGTSVWICLSIITPLVCSVFEKVTEAEREMEPDKKVEIIQKAIRKLMEEEEEVVNAKTSSSSDYEKPTAIRRRRRQLLSDLLSELESMEEKVHNVSETETDEKMNTAKEDNEEEEEEIIIKELKHIKRQNTTTHWLVSAMIVLTLAWQLSEISIILKIKDGLTNPLKSVGSMVGGLFKNRRRQTNNVKDMIKEIPELPPLGLPGFDTSDDDDNNGN